MRCNSIIQLLTTHLFTPSLSPFLPHTLSLPLPSSYPHPPSPCPCPCPPPLLHTHTGPVLSKNAVSKLEQIPTELFDLKSTSSMDGNGYVSAQLHQAFHHYIKVSILFYSILFFLEYFPFRFRGIILFFTLFFLFLSRLTSSRIFFSSFSFFNFNLCFVFYCHTALKLVS